MIDKQQLRDLIRRVLKEADLLKYEDGRDVELLMLTAAVESDLGTYIRQKGGGPALGIFQMEPATHDDIWDNYLKYKTYPLYTQQYSSGELETDIVYMIIMTRIHYLRVSATIPPAEDKFGLAAYWKQHYNTDKGKGSIDKALVKYKQYC